MLNGAKLGYKVTGRALVFDGFTKIYNNVPLEDKNDDDDDATEKTLPDMQEGDVMYLQDTKHEQKFTKPPQRYTDATLVKTMEENGIGRPSTYASIISVIAKRTYTEKDGKAIVPTPLGEAVCDFMVKNFPPIMDLKFTANMESELDNGKCIPDYCRKAVPSFPNGPLTESAPRYWAPKQDALSVPAVPGIQRPLI